MNVRNIIVALVLLLLLIVAAILVSNNQFQQQFLGRGVPTPTPQPIVTVPSITPSPTPAAAITVILNQQNRSGESGTATLSEVNGKTVVDLNIIGEPANANQPAHIHAGSCPNPGQILYPLSNVVNGKSQTTLSIALEQLLSQLPLAINVHRSTAQISVYVACGNINAATGTDSSIITTTSPSPVLSPSITPSAVTTISP